MAFRLVHANYDKKTRRAYIELRDDDAGGDEMIVAAIFFLSPVQPHDEAGAGVGSRDEGSPPYEAGSGRARWRPVSRIR